MLFGQMGLSKTEQVGGIVVPLKYRSVARVLEKGLFGRTVQVRRVPSNFGFAFCLAGCRFC